MFTTVEQFRSWLEGHEDEHLEFKEAKEHFDFEKLVKYCCALANEGGGKVILGVTDKKPRNVGWWNDLDKALRPSSIAYEGA